MWQNDYTAAWVWWRRRGEILNSAHFKNMWKHNISVNQATSLPAEAQERGTGTSIPMGPPEFLIHRLHEPSDTPCFMHRVWVLWVKLPHGQGRHQPSAGAWPSPKHLCIYLIYTRQRSQEECIVITILQARKLRHSEVKSLADRHLDTECAPGTWSQGDSDPGAWQTCLGGRCPWISARESPLPSALVPSPWLYLFLG